MITTVDMGDNFGTAGQGEFPTLSEPINPSALV